MKAQELRAALAELCDDDEVPPGDVLALVWPDVELSYVESALSQWCQISDMFGRGLHPEVEDFLEQLRGAL